MLKFKIIKGLLHQHRAKLSITYILFSIETIGTLMRPLFLGIAVNDLIKGSFNGLIQLSLIHFAWLVIGTIRHRYDTRAFSEIYTSLVTVYLFKKKSIKDVSKLTAHSTLARELVDFLETDIPYIIEALYNIIGSLVLLFYYDFLVVWVCLSILIPVMIVSHFYGKKMKLLTRVKNDELEKQVNILSAGNKESILNHFNQLRYCQIKISDNEAWNFGFIEMMVLIVIGCSLLISSESLGGAMLAGNLIGIYNYILKFVSGLDTIPYAVQKFSSLGDITERMDKQDHTLETHCPVYLVNEEMQQKDFKLSA
jgi:ABC-type multidrug transport system fused ATPase/permease subunit